MIRSTIFRNMCCMCSCVLFVSSTSVIGFNSSTKDTDQYFKTELNVEDSLPPKVCTHFPNGLSKFGERAHDTNLISTVVGFEPTTSRYQDDEFSARPENTNSYILNRTTDIITYIMIYIFTVVGYFVYSM